MRLVFNMKRPILKNKPLVEAIFELRWALKTQESGSIVDPHYRIVLGSLYSRIRDEYPFHEQLPSASIPDEMAPFVVQHRFRKEQESWPLVQLGPGIITLNATEDYSWDDFSYRIDRLIENFFESYPDPNINLKVNMLSLRYIDAIGFDYSSEDLFCFLQKNLKVNAEIDSKLFEKCSVDKNPIAFDFRYAFPAKEEDSQLNFRVMRAKKNGRDVLLWDTQIVRISDEALSSVVEIMKWVSEAHSLAEEWFFGLIEGDLIRRFQ